MIAGRIDAALAAEAVREIELRAVMLRLKLEHRLIALDRGGIALLLSEHHAQVVMRFGELRRHPHGLAQALFGLGELVPLTQDLAQVYEHRRIGLPAGDEPLEQFFSRLTVTGPGG
jgi:hypothetical protein